MRFYNIIKDGIENVIDEGYINRRVGKSSAYAAKRSLSRLYPRTRLLRKIRTK